MNVSSQVRSLLKAMTLEEKVGQLHQVPPFFFSDSLLNEVAGPLRKYKITEAQLYRVGSILGTAGPEEMRQLQTMYLEKSRLKIPLLFMADIIHGYKTIFPIPLAIAATMDVERSRLAAKIAAKEAATSGIHVTFSPMADLARDARWGRVMESSGEDPFLNYQMTYAAVKGYQGESLNDPSTLAACGKHVVAYGAAVAGKDYTQAEISKHSLYQYYLEGYRACVDAEAELLMSSFNVVEGVPSTVSPFVLKTLMRQHLGFKGVIISDYDSLNEAHFHHVTHTGEETALKGMQATLDIEMSSGIYQNHIIPLIQKGQLSERLLDQAVLRVLQLKEKIGLLDDPFRGLNPALEATLPLSEAHYQTAYDVAKASPILLQNEGMLPLNKEDDVVFVGSLLDEQNLLGAWAWHGEAERTASLAMVLRQRYSHDLIPFDTLNETHVARIQNAKKVVVVVGERSKEFGEARSKVSPTLSAEHLQLWHQVIALNPSVITLVLAGRPLVLPSKIETSKALLYSFYLGSAMADVLVDTLFGQLNPSGTLPMTLAREVGQLPLHTLSLPTGRPFEGKTYTYTSHYIEGINSPLYPLGYGLSYTSFSLLKAKKMHENDTAILLEVTVKNIGNIPGEHPVFAYLHTPPVPVALPEKTLVGVSRIALDAGATQTFSVTLPKHHFYYYDTQYRRQSFLGPFTVTVSLMGETLDVSC